MASRDSVHSYRDTGKTRVRQFTAQIPLSTFVSVSFLIGTMTQSPRRPGATLDAVLFAAALVAYALGVPLGLARVEVAPAVAAGIALDGGQGTPIFAVLVARVVGYLPLGDLALRANLASALVAALAVVLIGRLCSRTLGVLRPLATAREDGRSFAHEPIAVAAAALAVALSLSTFELGTTAGSAAATWALLAAGLLVGLSLLRDFGAAPAGCGLAALAGLTGGVDAVAGPLLWPLLVGLGIWALRKGARWPLLAPLAVVSGWGAAVLGAVASSTHPVSLAEVVVPIGRIAARAGAGLAATAFELVDQIGVVGILLAVIGLCTLAVRAAVPVAWLGLTLVSAMMVAHPAVVGPGPGRAALPVAVAIAAVFAAAGLLHVAGRLGRARLAAAVALAVMLVLTPAMDGGGARWLRRATLPAHLLDHALARAEVRSVVDPGTAEMDGLFRLARAIGLRPDLVIEPRERP